MLNLNENSVKFLHPYLLDVMQSEDNKTIVLHKSEIQDEIIKLSFITQTPFGVKFKLEVPNIFSLTMVLQDNNIIVYKYEDDEHYPNGIIFSIDEIDLMKEGKPVRIFHFILKMFTEAIIDALQAEYNGVYENQFDYYPFRTFRFLFLLFISETDKVCSWGVHDLKLLHETVIFNVQGHLFKGQVKIAYNRGADWFEISFLQNGILAGQRTGIYFDELLNYIDRKVEYVPEYGDN